MIRKLTITLVMAASLLGGISQPDTVFHSGNGLIGVAEAVGRDCSHDTNKDPLIGCDPKKTSVADYVNKAYDRVAVIGSLLAVIMLMWAGYRYMSSSGDPEKIADAKDIVEKSLIGLTLLILAALILTTINPRTTTACKPTDPGCGDIDFNKPKG